MMRSSQATVSMLGVPSPIDHRTQFGDQSSDRRTAPPGRHPNSLPTVWARLLWHALIGAIGTTM